jgi:hypothetical protein
MVLLQSPFAIAILKRKDMVVSLANVLSKKYGAKARKSRVRNSMIPELLTQNSPSHNVLTTGIPFTETNILSL